MDGQRDMDKTRSLRLWRGIKRLNSTKIGPSEFIRVKYLSNFLFVVVDLPSTDYHDKHLLTLIVDVLYFPAGSKNKHLKSKDTFFLHSKAL